MSGSNRWDEAVIIALGSNLAGGHRSSRALLEAAIDAFPERDLIVTLRSRWWRSAAWPDPTAPDYLNGVAIVETRSAPRETLAALRALEATFGRIRGEANSPRTLDLDLIAHGRQVIDMPDLTLPHPRAGERRFVMGPLAEIAPDWIHPVNGLTAATLADRSTVGVDAVATVNHR